MIDTWNTILDYAIGLLGPPHHRKDFPYEQSATWDVDGFHCIITLDAANEIEWFIQTDLGSDGDQTFTQEMFEFGFSQAVVQLKG